MKNYRLLPLGAILMILLSVIIFSCRETQVKPVEEQNVNQTPEFKITTDDIDAECYGLKYIPLTDDELKLLEEMGMDAFLEEIGLGDCKDYMTTGGVAQKYCNLKITKVIANGWGGPGVGFKFCVVCPPLCRNGGIMWKANGYRAKVTLNQAGNGCATCLGGVKIPRRRRPY